MQGSEMLRRCRTHSCTYIHENHDTHAGVGGDEQCGSPRTHGEGETQHKGFENTRLIQPRAFASRAQLDFAPQKLWRSFI